jgi:lipopolysaccharide/colanic/teichoic acid biosynthesis glycosyltransferase
MTQQTSRLSGLVTPRPALRTPTVTRLHTTLPNSVSPIPLGGIGEQVRVIVEFVLVSSLFLITFPLMLACIALVRITSRGPGIYTQTRVGLSGSVFTFYKIRTMYHDCESKTGPRWSPPNDPRITPVGRVLRKLHLDELPQLWNVLRGDMSLIGPRPERPEIVTRLRQSVLGYDRRHAVKPGITGFAQIHLPPDTCIRSVKNKLVYDLFYIRNRSVGMELYVLFATCLKLLGMKRHYQRKPRIPTE